MPQSAGQLKSDRNTLSGGTPQDRHDRANHQSTRKKIEPVDRPRRMVNDLEGSELLNDSVADFEKDHGMEVDDELGSVTLFNGHQRHGRGGTSCDNAMISTSGRKSRVNDISGGAKLAMHDGELPELEDEFLSLSPPPWPLIGAEIKSREKLSEILADCAEKTEHSLELDREDRELDASGSGKKRGRPKGSKNKMRSAADEAAAPSTQPADGPDNSGTGRPTAALAARGRRGRPQSSAQQQDSPQRSKNNSCSSSSTPLANTTPTYAQSIASNSTTPSCSGSTPSYSTPRSCSPASESEHVLENKEKRMSGSSQHKLKDHSLGTSSDKRRSSKEKTKTKKLRESGEQASPLRITALRLEKRFATTPARDVRAASCEESVPCETGSAGPVGKESEKSSVEAAIPSRRRGSKLSDSEDSSLSTDSPLKPKIFKRILAAGEHNSDKKPDRRKSSSGIAPDPPPRNREDESASPSSRPSERPPKSAATASPVEEQPLIPKRYLEQKRLESGLAAAVEVGVEKMQIADEDTKERRLAEDRREVERRLRSFKQITENVYLCTRKISKQFRNMQCDCDLSKEEVEKGVKGCLEDCANKMLMIECGRDCPLDVNCSNKRFQNKENAPIEVFKTEWKGFGVRATAKIPKDTFIMEYVGEALDHRQFRRRAKQYARENIQHFYFMALSRDCYVDATYKGNISRFINHSCDPNSMTQKWMVNGENRVGFFTKKDVEAGEELNFDYKYERYGQIAQKCYCGTARCRGWLGREPASDSGIEEMEEWTTSEEEEEEEATMAVVGDRRLERREEERRSQEKKERRRRRKEKMKKYNEEEEWEEDIQRLMASGIRNKLHTVELSRLMVRTSQVENRLRLTQLLMDADQPCRRLFLDYQGLRILSHWMQDLEWSTAELELKLRIQAVLANMSIPHRTMLKDSKVYDTMERWAKASPWDSGRSSANSSPCPPSRANSPLPATSREMDIEEEQQQQQQQQQQAPPTPHTTPRVEDDQLYPPGEEPPGLLRPYPSPPRDPTTVIPDPPRDSATTTTADLPRDSVTTTADLPRDSATTTADPLQPRLCQVDDDISIVAEISTPNNKARPLQSTSFSRSKTDMRLKVVQLPEAGGINDKEVEEMTGKKGKREEELVRLLSAQSGVGKEEGGSADVGTEEMGDVRVEPNPREELPLTEEEEREREEVAARVKEVQARAAHLLQIWSQLQEMFRIPKRERHKIRVEHEREADRQDWHSDRLTALQLAAMRYAEANRNQLNSSGRPISWGSRSHQETGRPAPDGRSGANAASSAAIPRERRNLRLDDKTGRLKKIGLLREDRRTLFEAKIQEEERQKTLRSSIMARHSQCCRLLGMNPATTPLLPQYGEQPHPLPPDAEWQPPRMAWLPLEAYRPDDPKPVNPRDVYPPGICPPEPPPPPKVIKVPGDISTIEEVMEYYDDLYSKAPKSPVISPVGSPAASQAPSPPRPVPAPTLLPAAKSTGSVSRLASARVERVLSVEAQNHQEMLDRLKQELHIGKTEELPDHYRSPSPVEKRSSKPPVPTTPEPLTVSLLPPEEPSPQLMRRILPRTIDFLNSEPAENPAFPQQSQPCQPLELELCNGPGVEAMSSDPVDIARASVTNGQTSSSQLVVKLPPKWRVARDGQGRVYYYHTLTKESQWEPPISAEQAAQETADGGDEAGSSRRAEEDEEQQQVKMDTLSSDDEDKEDDSESDEEQERDGDEEVDVDESELPPDQDLSASEKKMLLRIRSRNRLTKAERSSMRRLKRRKERQRREEERELLQARYDRHRDSGLVEEHLVPFRTDRDKADLSTFKEIKERLLHKDKILQQIDKEIKEEERRERQEQERLKREQKRATDKARREAALADASLNSSTGSLVEHVESSDDAALMQPVAATTPTAATTTTTAAADSSDVEKKIKDNFVKEMSKVIVKILNPYRSPGVKGHISSTEDFKHLAKKLTLIIMTKERQHCRTIEDLKATDKVKKKAAEYVKKKMSNYEREYKRSPDNK